jgi:hypothetical protein
LFSLPFKLGLALLGFLLAGFFFRLLVRDLLLLLTLEPRQFPPGPHFLSL